MVRAINLSFGHSAELLLDGVTFTVGNGMKVGLVGPNGAGKSTLFSLMLGHELPRAGTVTVEGHIELVPQEVKRDPILDESESVRTYINPLGQFEDHEIKSMLAGLEMPDLNLSAIPRSLSGGQKTKLALARALLLEPDVLLLDEPTNFLDIPGKRWVMNFLAHYTKTLIMVSHDLNLLDAHIDKVLALNKFSKKIEEYKGNYTQYLRLKAEADARLKREIINKQKQIKKMQESVQKMAGRKTEKGVHQRIILERRLEKAKENLPEMPKEMKKIKLQLQDPAWVGELPLRIMNVSKSYGDVEVLKNVTFSIKRGEKVVLLGRNGAGKSTLIKTIMGILDPDSGVVEKDEKLNIGYYSQEFDTFDLQLTLLQTMREHSAMPEGSLRSFLGRFLFIGDKANQKVATLSGGEKTRLSIATLMLKNYNLLILDEPTTYLDPLSQRVILEALKEYKGAMLLVSHTEEFVKELVPDKAYILPDEEMHYWSEELLDLISAA